MISLGTIITSMTYEYQNKFSDNLNQYYVNHEWAFKYFF